MNSKCVLFGMAAAISLLLITNVMLNNPDLVKLHNSHNSPVVKAELRSTAAAKDGNTQAAPTAELKDKMGDEPSAPPMKSRSSDADRHASSRKGVHAKEDTTGGEVSAVTSQGKWELGQEQAARVEENADSMLRKQDDLSSAVDSIQQSLVKGGKSQDFISREILSDRTRLKSLDYTHRTRRKGELTTMEMYRKLKSIGSEDGRRFVEFSSGLPTAINHYPPSFNPEVNVSVPFGSWKSAFFPITDALMKARDGTTAEASAAISHFRSPQLFEEQPPVYTVAAANSVISRGHLITPEGTVFSAGGCLWDFKRPQPGDALANKVPVGIALCDEWCKGFYHFTHEHLPRMALVHKMLTTRNDTFLVLSHRPSTFQLQFFTDILGVPRDRLVASKPVAARVGVYPMPLRCGNTFTQVLAMIRRLVWNRLSLSSKLEPTKGRKLRVLFAERRKLSRMPSNYHDLKDKLKKDFADRCDFNTTVGDTSATKQVQMFHAADIIIGPHGANIANMMWMPRGGHVIEMASAKKGNMCYYTTASRIDVTHQLLLHQQGKDSKYVVEYDELKQHLDFALKQLQPRGGDE